ncbi:MAG TPA: hypothetical protein VGN26_08380 [Armatimonadota bacterium]
MGENGKRKTETSRLRRLLKETARMAEHASLTEALPNAAKGAVQQYNSVLTYLENSEELPPGLFAHLDGDASFDSVGLASAQLAAYLDDDEPEREKAAKVSGDRVNVHIGNLSGLKDLQGLGEIIREHLPEWLKSQTSSGDPKQEEATAPEAISLSEVESRLAEVGARLQAAAEQLRRGDLSDDERASLADQLSQFGQEQARLARQHAMLRNKAEGAPAE